MNFFFHLLRLSLGTAMDTGRISIVCAGVSRTGIRKLELYLHVHMQMTLKRISDLRYGSDVLSQSLGSC